MKDGEFSITVDLFASRIQRFTNFCIDLLFVYILVLSLGTTIILVGSAINSFELVNWVQNLNTTEITFYSIIVAFLYYYLTEQYFSRTIAKLITHTLVVNADGSKPTARMFFLRSCCRFIPFEAFSFLGIVPRGWHDSFSKTYVVKRRKFNKVKKQHNSFNEVVEV